MDIAILFCNSSRYEMKIEQIIYNQFAPFMTKRPTTHPEEYKYEISSTREKNVCIYWLGH